MKVKAKPGTRCPKERKPRDYITDSQVVEVPATAYYRRLVRDGSLVMAMEKPAAKPVKKTLPAEASKARPEKKGGND
jgi:hypothetical protein